MEYNGNQEKKREERDIHEISLSLGQGLNRVHDSKFNQRAEWMDFNLDSPNVSISSRTFLPTL